MLNTCIPVVLAAKPAVQVAAQVVRRVARRVVGHGRRPSNTAAQAKLAAPKAVQAPAVCVKGAGLAAMKAAAVAGWLGTAGAAGYAAADYAATDVAAGDTPAAVAAPALASGFAPAAVGPTSTTRQAAVPAASFGTAPFGTAMRAAPTPPASDAPAAPETAAQPTTSAVSDALALAPADQPAGQALGEASRRYPLPDSVPGYRVPAALPLSAPAVTQVAEPGSLVLLAAGLLCFAASRTRSRRRV